MNRDNLFVIDKAPVPITSYEMSTADTVKLETLVYPIDEVWVPVDRHYNDPIVEGYWVSNYGKVYSEFTNKILTLNMNTHGYGAYMMVIYEEYRNNPESMSRLFPAHRLVEQSFNPILNYKDMQVNHINGNKLINTPENLEWVTAQENILHAIDTGLRLNSGENVSWAKYPDSLIHEVCKYIEQGYSYDDVYKMLPDEYKSDPGFRKYINAVRTGRNRKDITSQYNIQDINMYERKYALPAQTVREIIALFIKQPWIQPTDVIRIMNLDYETQKERTRLRKLISTIKRKERFKHLWDEVESSLRQTTIES